MLNSSASSSEYLKKLKSLSTGVPVENAQLKDADCMLQIFRDHPNQGMKLVEIAAQVKNIYGIDIKDNSACIRNVMKRDVFVQHAEQRGVYFYNPAH